MTSLWVASILGLVEGLTEFLPVSSTGHLIVAGHLLGFTGARASTFEIFIQLGAILAVVWLERDRFLGLLRPGADRSSAAPGFRGLRGVLLLGITTAPALLMGFLLHDVDGIGWRQALGIGLLQCLALWPGISRSGATIVGGLLCGLERRAAATYSFLAAVPVLAAATLYDLYKSRDLLNGADAIPFAAGFVVSFLAAALAIRTFIALLGRFTLRPFAWYRIAVAPLVWLLR